ncbi:RluA family pseudouridine synthase [Azospirillum picis]|uniref:tRNA pseudouridine32 synthase/23S rRNA pseudouridine746 synthase n=1 Tax=Azospirillum picis TaxID=488438 RepID=A0ABU0MCU1_9PROT|nr:RNA pseudouridine synthase [Azospirillum picis]MBP2297725.1 tRNA pseudouridine32 synthase/23S rRNA pseudouridine746 synthase [Azospirillum picis]MDQ0531252.1 tRNA pseudouridine32 synthase/23S rRNA pseudouridine746 synthase [Azospirillum picis]
MTPDSLRARVLHQDERCFVIDKPAGLAVHKAGRITDHLDLYLPYLAEAGGEAPKLAHRLDRDTAGCLILGRTPWALKRLGQMFAAGHVGKTYWAVADGIPQDDAGTIDLPLLKSIEPGAPRSSWTIRPDPAGQPAVTDYRVLGTGGGRSWLELRPRTGRTHQIRLHCAAIGCPLVGEPFYGPERRPPGNLHLLARSVRFRMASDHPEVVAVAPPPEHMRSGLAACGWTDEEGREGGARVPAGGLAC